MKKQKQDMNTQKPRTRAGNGNVFLEGDLTITQAQKITNDLNNALGKYDDLKVTVQNVTLLDLACIQLLYAFRKTCAQQNKKVLLDIKLNPDLELLLTKCGFNLLLMKCNK
jgi:ABC-type transporter Mla MlaB component